MRELLVQYILLSVSVLTELLSCIRYTSLVSIGELTAHTSSLCKMMRHNMQLLFGLN